MVSPTKATHHTPSPRSSPTKRGMFSAASRLIGSENNTSIGSPVSPSKRGNRWSSSPRETTVVIASSSSSSSSLSQPAYKSSPGIRIRNRTIQHIGLDEVSLLKSPRTGNSSTDGNSKENQRYGGTSSTNNSLDQATAGGTSYNRCSPLTLDSIPKPPDFFSETDGTDGGPRTVGTPSSGCNSLPAPVPKARYSMPRFRRISTPRGVSSHGGTKRLSRTSGVTNDCGLVRNKREESEKSSWNGTPPSSKLKNRNSTNTLELHVPDLDSPNFLGSPMSQHQSLPEGRSKTTNTNNRAQRTNNRPRNTRTTMTPKLGTIEGKVVVTTVPFDDNPSTRPPSTSSYGIFNSLQNRSTPYDFDNKSETIIFSTDQQSNGDDDSDSDSDSDNDDDDELDENNFGEVTQRKTSRTGRNTNTKNKSTSIAATDDNDDDFIQIMSRDRSANELGSLCGCMITVDDISRARYLCRGNAQGYATKRDYKGETPLHSFGNNKALAAVIGNPNNVEYETKDYLALYRQPTFDQESSSQLKLVVDRFLVDNLLPAFPGAIIIRDNDGRIPFEAPLMDWIATCRNHHQKGTGKDSETSYFPHIVSDAVSQAWETSTTILSAVKFKNRTSSRMSDNERVDKMEAGFSAQRHDSDGTDDLSTSKTNFGSMMEHATLSPHARFCVDMLSLIVDKLELFPKQQPSSNAAMIHDGGGSKMDPKKKHSGRATKGIHSSAVDLRGPSELTSTVVEHIASIPHLLETILSINEESDTEYILSTSIMRRVLLDKHSVGPWLTTMLQNPHRQVARRAVEYLHTVSRQLCSGKDSKENKRLGRSYTSTTTVDCDDFIDEVSRLPDFIPSLLLLGDRGIEEVSTTLVVKEVLDRMVARPFVATVVLCDAMFLITMIVGFRAAVNRMIVGAPLETVLTWIYVANIGIFYFIIGEIGKAVSLFLISKQSRKYFLSFWEFIDVLSVLFALTSSVAMRWQFSILENGFDDANSLRGLLAVTTGLLWLRALGFMKAINMQLATFVLAIIQIMKDVVWFCAILFALIVSFAQMFYTLLAPASCATGDASERQCKPSEYVLQAYTVLLGDFGTLERDAFRTQFSVFLVVIYSFLVCILLLNVLIAIAADSYEKCLLKSQQLFGRARVMLVAELASFQSLLRKRDPRDNCDVDEKNGIYSQWLSSGNWTGNWSRGSLLFFTLSMIVVMIWTVAELVGFAKGEQYGSIVFSLASVFVNIVLYIVMILFLGRHSGSNKGMGGETKEWSNSLQRLVLRTLGATRGIGNEPWKRKRRGEEEWNGRVHFLQREMDRIADRQTAVIAEQSESLQHMINLSESRVRTELSSIEKRFTLLEATLLQEVQGTRETNANVQFAVEELKALISMAGSSSENRSPVPSEVNINSHRSGYC
jgi:hypothetical protein